MPKNPDGRDGGSSDDQRTNSPPQTSPIDRFDGPRFPESTDLMDVDHSLRNGVDHSIADILLHYPAKILAGISSGGVEVSGIVSPREGQRIEVAENPPLVVEDEEGHIKPVPLEGFDMNSAIVDEVGLADTHDFTDGGGLGETGDVGRSIDLPVCAGKSSGEVLGGNCVSNTNIVKVVDQSGLGVIQTDSTVKYPLPVAEAERRLEDTAVTGIGSGSKDLNNPMVS
ncbi:uncharacterized protein LOC17874528 [Capsella rubella]|uniref:uncharacterized protein LOC17874528 n=1 Tax=Capsella rubella TaxID=81985 RepID=UPI000CD5AEDE|nr:uncharacterized protein LOC17874528 [Capsella rubella]